MEKSLKRTARNHIGKNRPHKDMSQVLPFVLTKIEKKVFSSDKMVESLWKQVIGEKIFPMTKVLFFEDGVLHVSVKTHTLYSLLVQHERVRLIKLYQKKFPHANLKDIRFKIG